MRIAAHAASLVWLIAIAAIALALRTPAVDGRHVPARATHWVYTSGYPALE